MWCARPVVMRIQTPPTLALPHVKQWGRELRGLLLAAMMLMFALASVAQAQYTPIPNFVGTLAGQQFRNALNNKLNGNDTIAPQLVHLKFANLPATVTNGQFYYVDDGTPGVPCTGGGAGAVATGIAGQW